MAHYRLLSAGLALVASWSCGNTREDSGGRQDTCEFVLSVNEISPDVPTVGVVEWSIANAEPRSATIVLNWMRR